MTITIQNCDLVPKGEAGFVCTQCGKPCKVLANRTCTKGRQTAQPQAIRVEPAPIDQARESSLREEYPCIYRGPQTEDVAPCKPCEGNRTLAVYTCDERAKCTIGTYRQGQKEVNCMNCRDRLAPVVFLP